ncbi:tRNA pseudouridine(55) synthase TruB [Blastomonas aquatica]|uniref:tRNA pseudouridine synthase B n=1 Tax=Blastomonas aquatica TaxID=1510276 RepID=A0ABQ1IQ26_9SPHN|nr:tRNA pseudouridine(55) synthase TruB [Blastomonas aquatica]GGB49747.1 tRNA pseudouridine synthase B [Blastomonas aquatica]
MHGWIILDKPYGMGSTDAVTAVKRAFRAGGHGKVKVGHGGTLDPLATGVLPIALGEATKLTGQMLNGDKTYDFTIAFGVQTDTLDVEGKPVAHSDVRPTLEQIETVLGRFTGPIEQVPPAFSALKVDGKRAYDLARAGEEVELASRAVTIHALKSSPARGGGPRSGGGEAGANELSLGSTPLPLHHPADGPPPRAGEDLNAITLTASVSKGTYIRSLARDIAQALGTVGHVTMLRRTQAGPFTLAGAISLDNLEQIRHGAAPEDIILPFEAGLDDIPALDLTPDQARRLQRGQVVTGIAAHDGRYWARGSDGTPLALVSLSDHEVRVVRGFNLG